MMDPFIETIKSQFPVFEKYPDLVFLDSAASTQKPGPVVDAMKNAYLYEYANIHRGSYELANKATENFENARLTISNYMGSRPEEIIFVRNATEGLNLISFGLANTGNKRKKIVVTALEHHANLLPWQRYAQITGKELVVIPLIEGVIDLGHIMTFLDEEVDLFAFPHVSNVLGYILPVREICDFARQKGIKTVVDGCQGIVHKRVDVKEIGCDFYVWSGHKMYGPTGIGVVYGRYEMMNTMEPFLLGGDMLSSATYKDYIPAELPNRFEAGTPAIIEAYGVAKSLDFLESNNPEYIFKHKVELHRYMREKLSDVDGIHVLGNNKMPMCSVVSFVSDWGHSADIGYILEKESVCLRIGRHCAEPLVRSLGLDSTMRASIGIYNQKEDVDRLIHGLQKAKRLLG